ncbi:hypothetical protein Rhopal_002443-T1 [Rhodotorula paludigena]|uniref:Thioredoxin domain-containing protein n=1 Tax=Rhodotorula paludigena TaxID=86838 RepID=A0AAV5GJC7_9BASI|nr:hypothetical protein Rhopal_002443-T1 [Rhodotorula paludigena]
MRWSSNPAAALVATLSALSLAGCASAAPIVTVGDGLTEETWGQVKSGTWLVEHYSPYCSHCKAFAPKWKELVETYADAAAAHDFHFAQVDCASNGDLCHSHDVKYYPSIFLYEKGEFSTEFTERRTLEELGKFVEEHYPVKAEKLAREKEQQEEQARKGSDDEVWDRKEQYADEQEPMGLGLKVAGPGKAEGAPRREKGEGKARLPTEPKDGGAKAAKPGLPQLHVTEDEDDGAPTRAPAQRPRLENDEDDQPFEALLADAQREIEAEEREASLKASGDDADAQLSTQTPPGAESTSRKFNKPAFIAQQPAEKKRSDNSSGASGYAWPAVDGEVRVLSLEQAQHLKDEDAPPSFVKFYAPWCSHCKSLAPKWKDLASTLAPSGVHVYELDCDDAANKKACRAEGVKAYPTLMFYNKGAAVEYLGKRDVKSLKEFALKAASATMIKHLDGEQELQRAVREDEVVVLFLHRADTDKEDIDVAHAAARSLMGTSPFYSSSSPELFPLLSLPSHSPTLVVLKDHSLTASDYFIVPPASSAAHPTSQKRILAIKQWLRSAKLPTVSELNGATYADLMPEDGSPPLVGLAVLSRSGLGPDGFESAKKQVEALARGWTERRRARGEKERGRDVLWAWVEGDKWAAWARSMYDVKMGGKEAPAVVIADPKELVYWSTSLSDSALELGAPATVYELVEQGIYAGRAPTGSSRQFLERVAHSFVRRLETSYEWCWAHPILFVVALVGSWVVLWRLLRKAFAGSPGGYVPLDGPKRE